MVPFVDTTAESGTQTLKAQVQASSDSSYQVDSTDTASIDILDPPSDSSVAVVEVSRPPSQFRVAEGTTVTYTFARQGGHTTLPLTVDVWVDDPNSFLRGDYWNPPPAIPTQVTFPANATSQTLDLAIPDDGRDLPNGAFTVTVLPSTRYLLSVHDEATTTSATVNVTDDDTAQELELSFGKDGANDADVNEGDTLKFVVKRRQQDADTGQTASFTVRLETDRRATRDYQLADWKTDDSTGRLFKDFQLELTGSDTEVEETLEVVENGMAESNWSYRARILRIRDHAGRPLSAGKENDYWTVKTGLRETEIDATDGGDHVGTVTLTTSQTSVYEGGGVVYTLTRTGGPIGAGRNIGLKTYEPNRASGGSNPSEQTNYPYFPAWETTTTYTVSAYVDGVTEDGTDTLKAELVGNIFYTPGTPNSADVEIDDPPSNSPLITVTASPTSLVEGGQQNTATLTFTRTGGDTTQELTVNVEVEDYRGLPAGQPLGPGAGAAHHGDLRRQRHHRHGVAHRSRRPARPAGCRTGHGARGPRHGLFPRSDWPLHLRRPSRVRHRHRPGAQSRLGLPRSHGPVVEGWGELCALHKNQRWRVRVYGGPSGGVLLLPGQPKLQVFPRV